MDRKQINAIVRGTVFGLVTLVIVWVALMTPGHRTYIDHPQDALKLDEAVLLRAEPREKTKDGDPYPGTTLRAGTNIQPMAIQQSLLGRVDWIQVVSETGEIGFVSTKSVHFIPEAMWSELPIIRGSYIYPTTRNAIEEHMLKKSLEEVVERYGPVSSLEQKGNGWTAQYNYVEVADGKQRFRDLTLLLDKRQRVIEMIPTNPVKLSWFDRLPMADFLRQKEFFVLNGSVYMHPTGSLLGQASLLLSKLKTLHWTTAIISFFIGILLMFLVYSIPRFLLHPLKMLIWQCRVLGNSAVTVLVWSITLFCNYLFFLYLSQTDVSVAAHAVFLLLTFLFWARTDANHLAYERCNNCHAMGYAVGRGSLNMGTETISSVDSYQKFKGREETATEIIDKYEVGKIKTTKKYDLYRDKRFCTRCKHAWGVNRSVLTSVQKQNV